MEGDSPAARVKTRSRSRRPAESSSRGSESIPDTPDTPDAGPRCESARDNSITTTSAALEAHPGASSANSLDAATNPACIASQVPLSPTKRKIDTPPTRPTATPQLPTPPTPLTPTAYGASSIGNSSSSSAQESLKSLESPAALSRPHPPAFYASALPTPPTSTHDNGGQDLINTCCLPPEICGLEAKPSPFTARAQYMPESATNPMRQTLCGAAIIRSDQPRSMSNPFRAMDFPVSSLEPALEGLQPENITYWEPASLLHRDNKDRGSTYALLVLNQPIQNLSVLKLIWKKAFFRIAADGGANRLALAFKDPCLAADFEKPRLDVICGDLDSLSDQVRRDSLRRGTKIVEEKDQNSTDFTKCVKYLRQTIFPLRSWSSNILCLGGLGGRVDQGLSQLHHLFMEQNSPTYETGRVYLLSTESITFVLKSGIHSIRVRDPSAAILGKHIGIIPLKEKSIITTEGLEWDVKGWETEMGGQISTSNHVRADVVNITTTADVLFTIDLNFPDGNHDHRSRDHRNYGHMEPSRKSLRYK